MFKGIIKLKYTINKKNAIKMLVINANRQNSEKAKKRKSMLLNKKKIRIRMMKKLHLSSIIAN